MTVLSADILPEPNTVPGKSLVNTSERMSVAYLALATHTESLVTLGTRRLQLFAFIDEAKGTLRVQEHRAIQDLTR